MTRFNIQIKFRSMEWNKTPFCNQHHKSSCETFFCLYRYYPCVLFTLYIEAEDPQKMNPWVFYWLGLWWVCQEMCRTSGGWSFIYYITMPPKSKQVVFSDTKIFVIKTNAFVLFRNWVLIGAVMTHMETE